MLLFACPDLVVNFLGYVNIKHPLYLIFVCILFVNILGW